MQYLPYLSLTLHWLLQKRIPTNSLTQYQSLGYALKGKNNVIIQSSNLCAIIFSSRTAFAVKMGMLILVQCERDGWMVGCMIA